MQRRDFLKAGLIGSFGFSMFPYAMFASERKLYPSDRVKLGNTGIQMSRMAVGTGTSGWGGSSAQSRQLGIRGLSDLLEVAYDDGINFWDSADQYGTHPHLKAALKRIPREEVVILTKTTSSSYEGVKRDIDRFRREIGTDYLDIVLLHAVTDARWNQNMKGAMEALDEAQEQGIVRSKGISCHSLGALETAAGEPWVEVDLARYNPAGVMMDADVKTVRQVLQRMKSNGKTVIGMKVYGAGRLVDHRDECLEFNTGAGFIDAFTLGIENLEQLRDVQERLPLASVRA